MDFYYGIRSGNSSRSLFALHEAGVPYVGHPLNVPRGDSRAPAYMAHNPLGKVPALVDGEVALWESNAINWYVAETNPAAGLLPMSAAGRARVQKWLFFQAAHVSPACIAVYRVTNEPHRNFWGTPIDEQAAEGGMQELKRFLPVLDAALERREWLEGDFSLADIAYTPHLWLLAEGGFDFSSIPSVRAWLVRLYARPAWQRARTMVFGD